jgi:hypothetical protein
MRGPAISAERPGQLRRRNQLLETLVGYNNMHINCGSEKPKIEVALTHYCIYPQNSDLPRYIVGQREHYYFRNSTKNHHDKS